MKAYSMDLRQRIYGALERESIRRTAERFEVSEYFMYSLKKRYRQAGTLAPKAHRGGQKRRVDEAGSRYIKQVLAEEPDLTLNELCQRYLDKFAQLVSKSAMDRALKWLGITRKKRPLRSPTPQRACPSGTSRLCRTASHPPGWTPHRYRRDGGLLGFVSPLWPLCQRAAGLWHPTDLSGHTD